MPSTDYLASVVDCADDAIVCHDRDGRITLWNPAAERLLGYAAADIIGRDIAVLFPPESQHEEAAALARILSGGGGTTSSDSALVAESGQLVEVEDTGIGIKPEDEHRLFIEFQQLDASTAKKFSGSGLGLALTKRLVEAQGGTVGVRSVVGEGSTFFATLPQHVTAESAEITGPVTVTAR